ncbi:unnamed protein product [Brassica rapa subsp. narinosa]
MYYQVLFLPMYNFVLEVLTWILPAKDVAMKKKRSIMLFSNVLMLSQYGDAQIILWLVNFQIILKITFHCFSS